MKERNVELLKSEEQKARDRADAIRAMDEVGFVVEQTIFDDEILHVTAKRAKQKD